MCLINIRFLLLLLIVPPSEEENRFNKRFVTVQALKKSSLAFIHFILIPKACNMGENSTGRIKQKKKIE